MGVEAAALMRCLARLRFPLWHKCQSLQRGFDEQVLELANLSRGARGMIRINQYAPPAQEIDLETATLPDLLIAENITDEHVCYSTKKDAKAVAIAWTEVLPEEFGARYSNNLQGYCVRLPQALRDFMNL